MSKKLFLYLLPFVSGDRFKIGIADNLDRVRTIDRLYQVNFELAYQIHAKRNSLIRSFEKQLLSEYEDYVVTIEIKSDGWTEIRSIDVFHSAINDLTEKKSKKPGLEIQIEPLTREIVYPPLKEKLLKNPAAIIKKKEADKIIIPAYDYQLFTRAILGGNDGGRKFIEFIKSNPEKQSFKFHKSDFVDAPLLARWAIFLEIPLLKKNIPAGVGDWIKPVECSRYCKEEQWFEIFYTDCFRGLVLSGEVEEWIESEGVPESCKLPPNELDHEDYYALIEAVGDEKIHFNSSMPFLDNMFGFLTGSTPFYQHLDKIGYKQIGKNQWAKESSGSVSTSNQATNE